MTSSDFRTEARRKLTGRWGKVACISLAYIAVFFILGFFEGLFEEGSILATIIAIAIYVIEIPLSFGLLLSIFNVFNESESKAFDFLSLGFKNFAKAWKIAIYMFLKLVVPIILIIVFIILMSLGLSGSVISTLAVSENGSSTSSGFMVLGIIGFIGYIASLIWAITKSYYYQLSYVIGADQPQLTAKEAVMKSEEIMRGNRAKLFWLQLSFIGWALLAVFTLGIGYLWLLPYIYFATFAFYKHINGDDNIVVNEENPENENNI